ncbi:glycosyltransferase family 39 protein [Parafrigoribacterium soli]|uniref:glycosyltransferase family 39 protein n=1 Tax=Parafrigoribacterium soli TaxID=3144663 RepID=UPI0032EBC1B9
MTATSTPVRPTAEVAGSNTDAVVGRQTQPRIRGIAIVFGLLAAVVSVAGSWIPSFWGDEAASIMSAERPLDTLFPMLGRVDAVHGFYYLFLHGWITLFGASEFSVRLPSAVGVGLAAAGTVVLAAKFFDRRIAIIAGLVFAVLPRVTYMGAEARSYALGTAIAVWLTVWFVLLLRRRTTRILPWLLYSAGLALAVYSFLYLVLLVLVHAAMLVSVRRSRDVLRRWLGFAALGVLLALPLIAFALGEHGQISFLGKRPKFSANHIFVTQWFGNGWLAALCWAIILVAITVAVRSWWRSRPRVLPTGMVLMVAWLVLPTLLLELGNIFVAPMYTTRYLSFCTPAVAILIAAGIAVLARNWMRTAAVVLLLVLAAPGYLAQRGPYAKNGGSDWRQASALIAQHARPGDAIVFDAGTKPSQRPRLAMRLYPKDYVGLDDVGLMTPYAQTTSLWDTVAPVERVADGLASTNTVWAMELKPGASTPTDVAELQDLGFQVRDQYRVHRTVVYELSRETS